MEEALERSEIAQSGVANVGSHSANTEGEFYQLRTYTLRTGPQLQIAQTYFERALIPALNRLGLSPIGAFELLIGPATQRIIC